LDTVAPTLTITNPASSVVSQLVIQLQGYASEPLSSLTFDVSNATGVWTNQPGYLAGQFFDTNLFLCTTNYFQCLDVALGDGLNTITLHAADWAGNTTNISFTLEYSANTNAPALTVIWPPDGTYISGSQFTLQGQVDDATAKITAFIVDASGNTNSVQGLVERSGLVWIQNLPLAAGTNTLTVTATDAAGNASTKSMTLYQSSVLVTMNPLSSDQLNQSFVTVYGTVSDATAQVYVNGVEAYYIDGEGDWEADGVPVSPTGTAIFDVEVYGGSNLSVAARAQTGLSLRANDLPSGTPTGSEQVPLVQPATLVTVSYLESLHRHESDVDDHYVANWVYNNVGSWVDWGQSVGNEWPFEHVSWSYGGSFSTNGTIWYWNGWSLGISFGPPWSYASYSVSNIDNSTDANVMIVPSGQQTTVGTNFYLVRACASEFSDPAASGFNDAVIQGGSSGNNGDVPLPPEWLQINGKTLINSGITNDDGSVWGETIVSAFSGMPVDVTPKATKFYVYNDYTFNVQVTNVTLQSLTVVSNSATQIDAMNWAVVKSLTNDYVIVQAVLNYTNDWILTNVAMAIQWTGGEAVPGNPLQRRVTKTNSVETTVAASLGSSTTNLNVWVIWATVTNQITGINTSPLSFTALGLPDDNLSTQYYDRSTIGVYPASEFDHTNLVVGKICVVATVTPVGVHSVITNGWDVVQMKTSTGFTNGVNEFSYPPWTYDGPDQVNTNKTVIPDSNDKLYTIDGPNLDLFLEYIYNYDSREHYINCYDYITWKSQTCSDTNNFWHFEARWKTNQIPQFNNLDFGNGTITIPTNSYYPSP
jgi:hypothetical protein